MSQVITDPLTRLRLSSQVITDPLTSRSKGYGFVRFGSEAERDRALGEMSGHFISNRPIRVSLATAKKSSSLQVPTKVTLPVPCAQSPSVRLT